MGSAVTLHTLGVAWDAWIGRRGVILDVLSVKLVSRGIWNQVAKNMVLEGKSDFRSCSEVVLGVLIWLRRDSVVTICWNELVVVKDLINRHTVQIENTHSFIHSFLLVHSDLQSYFLTAHK